METVSLGTTTSPSPVQSTTPSASSSLTEQQRQHLREQEKIEFYRTYDVMTGVRIAATLGGFFGLMVILVLYKSKSKTEKVLFLCCFRDFDVWFELGAYFEHLGLGSENFAFFAHQGLLRKMYETYGG